jgi:hypothetical protein
MTIAPIKPTKTTIPTMTIAAIGHLRDGSSTRCAICLFITPGG